MHLYTFEVSGRRILCAEQNGQLVDLCAGYNALRSVGKAATHLAQFPPTLLAFLLGLEESARAAAEVLSFAERRPAMPVGERLTYFFDEGKILPPNVRPGKILCSEDGLPAIVSKLPSTMISSNEAIVLPPGSKEIHYTLNLAAIISKRVKKVSEAEAASVVGGYTILNNLFSGEDHHKQQGIAANNFDNFCVLGPCLVTNDQLAHPANLSMRSFVRDQVKQETTSQAIFPLTRLISSLSQIMTLEPGDIVSSGVTSPAPLKQGDIVRLEIEKIGRLDNPVVAA